MWAPTKSLCVPSSSLWDLRCRHAAKTSGTILNQIKLKQTRSPWSEVSVSFTPSASAAHSNGCFTAPLSHRTRSRSAGIIINRCSLWGQWSHRISTVLPWMFGTALIKGIGDNGVKNEPAAPMAAHSLTNFYILLFQAKWDTQNNVSSFVVVLAWEQPQHSLKWLCTSYLCVRIQRPITQNLMRCLLTADRKCKCVVRKLFRHSTLVMETVCAGLFVMSCSFSLQLVSQFPPPHSASINQVFFFAAIALGSKDIKMSVALAWTSSVNETKMLCTFWLSNIHSTVGFISTTWAENTHKNTEHWTPYIPNADLVLHFRDQGPLFNSQHDQGHFLQLAGWD